MVYKATFQQQTSLMGWGAACKCHCDGYPTLTVFYSVASINGLLMFILDHIMNGGCSENNF